MKCRDGGDAAVGEMSRQFTGIVSAAKDNRTARVAAGVVSDHEQAVSVELAKSQNEGAPHFVGWLAQIKDGKKQV
jgi:hypothetical protein